jgi:hypothetical protein
MCMYMQSKHNNNQVLFICTLHYSTIYCNVEYIEIKFEYCCVLTACICMYIHIIHCNDIIIVNCVVLCIVYV